MGSDNVLKLKRGKSMDDPELKMGGGPGNDGAAAMIVEKVENGYVFRVVRPTEENELVFVFATEQRDELLRIISQNL